MATEDARYRQTSQYQLWSFSPTQLAAMREKTNIAARTRNTERLASLPAPSSAPSSSANTPDPEGTSTPALPKFLTPSEELLLVNFYTTQLLIGGDFANYSDEIKATAAIFYRRFFVANSIMTYPPLEMILVALFFGLKAEGHFINIREFCEKFSKKHPEEILAGEFLLCQGLRFALDVKHPFRALRGAVMELRTFPEIDPARITAAEQRAREILRFSPLMTDAYFHYAPSQIMLAALSLADRGLAERIIQETFHHVPHQPSNNNGGTPRSEVEDRAAIIGSQIRDKVLGTVEACRDMLSKELPERREHWSDPKIWKQQLQPIRKKLLKCRDPERWNLVELQKARREQAVKTAGSEDDEPDDRGDDDVFSGGGGGGGAGGPAKRRKVLDDPFGPAL